MPMKGGILGAGGGGGSPSGLSGMDLVYIGAGVGADPIDAPYNDDIPPTFVEYDLATWVNPVVSGKQVGITKSGIYMVNASVFTPDVVPGLTGIITAWPDWGENTESRARGITLIDLANGGSGEVTFLFTVYHDFEGSFGVGISIPIGVDSFHWQWNAQVVRLGEYA